MRLMRYVALLLVVALCLALVPVSATSATIGFKDVPDSYWAYQQIQYLAAKKILSGYADGTFRPENSIKRDEFASMLVTALGLKQYRPAKPTFTDVSPKAWSYGYIEAAVKAGYIKGITTKTYGPSQYIKRADLAVLMVRAGHKTAEAAKIIEAVCFANDEAKIPAYARGAMTVAFDTHQQYLVYRSGRMVAPLAAATRADCAKGVYMLLVPPTESSLLTLAVATEPDTLFAPLATSGVSVDDLAYCRSPLVGLDNTETPFPYLAKEIPSIENGSAKIYTVNGVQKMKVTLHLRKGFKWSDGVPITSKDVAFTEEMIKNPKVRVVRASATYTDDIEKVETPDAYTVIYYYKILSSQYVLARDVQPEHILRPIYEKNPADLNTCSFNTAPITNGPYMLEKWVHNSYVSLVANPYYPLEKPLIKRIVIKNIPDNNTVLAGVIAGTIDQATLDPQQAKVIGSNPKLTIRWWQRESGLTYMGCNLRNPLLQDKRVRQAMAYAMNREEFNKNIYGGKDGLAVGPIMKSSWAFDSKATVYHYNPDKAKALLKEAGYTAGSDGIMTNKEGKKLAFTLTSTTYSGSIQIVTFIQAQLRKVGIAITLASYPSATFYSRVVPQGLSDLYWAGWIEDPLFPGVMLSYRNDQIPTKANGWSGINWSCWNNREATDAIKTVSTIIDKNQAKEYYAKVQELFTDELPEIPWNENIDIDVQRSNLRNMGGRKGGVNRLGWNSAYWYFEITH